MKNPQGNPNQSRLHGLDLARFISLIGMVIVNFNIMMMLGSEDNINTSWLAEFLQGKAAATFVVLAGLGLGLNFNRSTQNFQRSILKRTGFLFIIGMINALIFPADIIHYYAFYFLFGMMTLKSSDKTLWFIIIGLPILSTILLIFLNYDTGWNWDTLHYIDFWTISGFTRNLFFNGWHPVIPWLSFLLFGIWLSRRNLHSHKFQMQLIAVGITTYLTILMLSNYLIEIMIPTDPEVIFLLSTTPIPPTLFYMATGMGISITVIGLCLWGSAHLPSQGLHFLTAPGKQTLTLYIAHILIGLPLIELYRSTGNASVASALFATFIFCSLATLYAAIWSHFFKRGPLESIMHRLTR